MRNRFFRGIAAIVCAVSILSGCNGNTGVEATEASAAYGEVPEDATVIDERGIAITVSKEYEEKGVTVEGANENLKGYKNVGVYYYYHPITDKLFDDMIALSPDERTDEVTEAFYEQMYAHSKCLMCITLVPNDEYKNIKHDVETMNTISGWTDTEYLGENAGYSYLVSIPQSEDTSKMGKEELDQYHECLEYMKTVRETLVFTELKPETDETTLPDAMPTFETVDLDGNKVTNDIFGNADVTVVNLWGTFCTPCIEEMPELQEWYSEMGPEVQIIGVVADVDGTEDTEHLELAKKIRDKAAITFKNIIPDQSLKNDLLNGVLAFPTTFLVDRNGNIIPDTNVEGAQIEKYKALVESYLKELK